EKDNDTAALDKLRSMGINLKPVEFPKLPVQDLLALMYTEFSAAFDDLTRSNRDDLLARQGKGSDANLYRKNRFVPAVEYIQATRVRTLLMEEMAKIMPDLDVYVAPITANRGPRVPGSIVGSTTTLANVTGHPGVVVRNGFNAKGVPTSMTFIGKIYGEADMLALAHAYQVATSWHTKHPEL